MEYTQSMKSPVTINLRREPRLFFLLFFFLPLTAVSAQSVYYMGSVGDYPGFMHLVRSDDSVSGWYFYLNGSAAINLRGSIDGDKLTLSEFYDNGVAGAQFQGSLERGVFSGSWRSAGQSSGRQGSGLEYPFEYREFAREGELTWSSGREGTDADIKYPLFASCAEFSRALALFHGYAVDNLSRMSSDTLERVSADSSYTPWASGSLQMDFNVTYASEYFISIVFNNWEYSGGAHGNYDFDSYLLMNTPIGYRPMELGELFKHNADYTGRLSVLALADLKAQGASLVTNGQIQRLQLTDLSRFSISPGGMTFYFSPYMVGSYVEGSFTVDIPWEQIGDILTDSAVERLVR